MSKPKVTETSHEASLPDKILLCNTLGGRRLNCRFEDYANTHINNRAVPPMAYQLYLNGSWHDQDIFMEHGLFTWYHTRYWAHALSLKGTDGTIESLTKSISNARVDLNPHQIDAALFSLRSPLSNGAILADEVGLGKTIEAGIVLSQRWAERRKRILLIMPAMLRKQWEQELAEKFYLPSVVLDSKVFNSEMRSGSANPFDQDGKIVICSYHFASAKASEISLIPWDMVVIDEAHRLRNVYRSKAKTDPLAKKSMAHKIADAIGNAPKLLLTATPLQNSLMELYGLVSVIDPHVFGDPVSYRQQFVRSNDEEARNDELRLRMKPLCVRTLRKQVTEYVPFTKRISLTQDFLPSEEEQELYDKVSAYLHRECLMALPASQRQLITLVLRKLLASSTFAIAGTLRSLIGRLEELQEEMDLIDDEDIDGIDGIVDEWEVDEDQQVDSPPIDPVIIQEELNELRQYADLAESIQNNAKGEALLPALETAFSQAEKLGAQRKVVIFTESRRTQDYLFNYLSDNGYRNDVATINGSNADPHSKEIYEQWLSHNEGTDRVSGSKSVDIKAAIVEHFRDNATVLVATEAAAEGVNLQFSSLVVNYDLPWNPQRIEQRIGRCHRYGQEHDVVVVNFLNRKNKADLRVFQLLSEKFRLFDGVFGASDEVLGALESGVDIERRIAQVYQECRTPEQIQVAFDSLQEELDDHIQSRLTATRRSLLEHFDEDVRTRLRFSQEKTLESMSRREKWLFDLTRTELDGQAAFDATHPRFSYNGNTVPRGWYNLDWKDAEKRGEHFYRQEHPLAGMLIETALSRSLPVAEIVFDYSSYESKVSILEPLVGQSGWLEISKLTVNALNTDEYLLFAAKTETGRILDAETCVKLMQLPGAVGGSYPDIPDLSDLRQKQVQDTLDAIDKRNGQFIDEEVLKLDRWSEDLKLGLEREIKEIDEQIREARKLSALAQSLQDKLEAQKAIKTLERTRNKKRRKLFDAQDAIDVQREELIKNLERQLKQERNIKPIFKVSWQVI